MARRLQLGNEDLGGEFALVLGELGDRCQLEEVGEFVIVDPHDRDVLWHAEPEVAGGETRPDRHLVGCRKDRGRTVMWMPEGLFRVRIAIGHGEVSADHRLRGDREPRGGHCLLEAYSAVTPDVKIGVFF